MGYTVAVRPTTKEEMKIMTEFMEKNYRPWSILFPGEVDLTRGPLNGKELSYDHSSKSLGFDYSSGAGPQREYVHAIVRWMALRIGVKKNGIPQYVYDGDEYCPVTQKNYDEHGWFIWKAMGRNERLSYRLQLWGYAKTVFEELKRLSKLWEEAHAGNPH